MTDNADGNGKITMAVLGQKMDEVLRRLDSIERNLCGHDIRINQLEIGQSERRTSISDMKNDIANLEKKSESWSLINTLGAIVAGIIGAIGISK